MSGGRPMEDIGEMPIEPSPREEPMEDMDDSGEVVV
jgi:hypothetical protein